MKSGVIGSAIAAIAMALMPTTAATASKASIALEPLIRQCAELERKDEDDESVGLRDVSLQGFRKEIDTRRQLLEKIRRIDAGGLSREEDIDRRLMIGLLESTIHTAEARRLWENDASLYVPASEIGRALEPTAPGSPQQRAAALTNLLRQVPARIEQGRKNLVKPPRSYTESAIFRTEGTIKLLRSDTPGLAKEAGAQGKALNAAAASALTALDSYGKFLREDLLPRSTGTWVFGKENYDYVLKHRWFLDADADAILARGQQAFAETEALAQQVAQRIQPGAKHWTEVYETLKDDHPAADGIKQAYQAKIDAAQAFVIEHRIVTLPPDERVITIDTPPALRRSSPFGTFQSVDPFGDDREGKLVLTPIEEWMTPAQRNDRLRSHHTAWIPIIAVHEAYPGHHVDGLIRQANPRLLRKAVREPIMSEGWGLFTEEMMYEQGFLQGDDVRLTQLRNRLWRAARVIMDVSLHTGRMTYDEAVTFLAEKVRFDRYAAALDVDMYTLRPTYVLGYLIGMQEIEGIRKDYIAKYGEPSPPSEFYDRLLSVGSIPPALVRESLFAQRELPLYPGEIPNSLAAPDEEATRDPQEPFPFLLNVSRPTMTVYEAQSRATNRPAVIILPGGSYRGVSIVKEGHDVARAFNELGITAFVVKYRTPSERHMLDKTRGPLQDAQQAIRAVRERADEWHIDRNRIGVVGFSAGGHLAATLATQFDRPVLPQWQDANLRPDFSILIYPVISFSDELAHRGSREQLLGKSPAPDLIRHYSSELNVTERTPPTFLVHAADDATVAVGNSMRFAEALRAHKVPVELIVYPSGGHGFGLNNSTTRERWFDRCAQWLEAQGIIATPARSSGNSR
jgi:uncharacterized protein (DUF885 family)/dienelactone hydrolase